MRENIAQALGGISPWHPDVGRFNEVQANLLMVLRYGHEIEEQAGEDAFNNDTEMLRLKDEAMFGDFKAPPPEFDEDDEGFFDYQQLSEL